MHILYLLSTGVNELNLRPEIDTVSISQNWHGVVRMAIGVH